MSCQSALGMTNVSTSLLRARRARRRLLHVHLTIGTEMDREEKQIKSGEIQFARMRIIECELRRFAGKIIARQ